jgi:hypothetical protein
VRRTLLAVLLLAALARAEEPSAPAAPASVLDRFRLVGSCESEVREISGAVALPGSGEREGTLLVVSDQGRWSPVQHAVLYALYRVPWRIAEGDSGVETGEAVPVDVSVVERIGAPPVRPGASVDWEGIAAIPGTSDLYVVSAERQMDGANAPANRAYVVRHPADGRGPTTLLSVLVLPALPADGENDRFEGVAVLPAVPPAPDRWRLWLFKERTTPGGGVPVVLPAPGSAFRLSETAADVATQSDAAAAADGSVWVLDRWQRRLQRTRPAPDDPARLVRDETCDLWPVLRSVAGETLPLGTPPPGRSDLVGYGLHEAIAFDASGRLFLAADRGEGLPSVVTVLAPRR